MTSPTLTPDALSGFLFIEDPHSFILHYTKNPLGLHRGDKLFIWINYLLLIAACGAICKGENQSSKFAKSSSRVQVISSSPNINAAISSS